MKKSIILLFLLEFISAFVLIFFFDIASFHVGNFKRIPFGLSSDYAKISAAHYLPKDEDKFDKLGLELKKILDQDKCTVILENFQSQGLALYDTNGIYENSLESGIYFSEEEFKSGSSDILVAKDSFAYKYSKKNDSGFYSNGEVQNVRGVIGKSSPLYKNDYLYIYNLINNREFEGDYYIDTKGESVVSDINQLLSDFGFQTEVNYPSQGETSLIQFMGWFNTQRSTKVLEIGVIVVYFNIIIYFVYFISKQSKNISIRLRLGASKLKIHMCFSKYILPICIMASLSGILPYNFIFQLLNIQERMYLSTGLLLIAILFHTILTYILFTIVFYLKADSDVEGGYK